MIIDPEKIAIRDLSKSDIPFVLKYWFHSPPGFVEAMGVDPDKMPKESEWEASLLNRLLENEKLRVSKLTALTITYDELPIGFHTISPINEGDFGILHAHIWNPEYRRQGIGIHSYPRACRIFCERFDLNKILFKTPVQNSGAIRVKEKLGIRSIGEEVIGFGIIKDGILAKVYELTRAEINQKWP